MADQGFKNNAGVIEWYQDGSLLFSIWDSSGGNSYVVSASGILKVYCNNNLVLSMWEAV